MRKDDLDKLAINFGIFERPIQQRFSIAAYRGEGSPQLMGYIRNEIFSKLLLPLYVCYVV